MKRRIIKKNINRFITPLIKDLPVTIYGQQIIEIGNDESVLVGTSHSIVNGEVVPEGCRFKRCSSMLYNIRKTAEKAKEIIETHNHVYLRVGPEVRFNAIRIRLITE